MASYYLYVVSALIFVVMAASEPRMSWDAKEVLLNLADDFGINNISSIRPIYRKDLPQDYVAYWEIIVNQTDQLIISSGPNTGDSKFKMQGPLPSMTEILDETAEDNMQKCVRYYMISNDVTMLCENEEGHVVATSRDEYINFESEDLMTKYQYIEDHLEMMAADWRLHAEQILNSVEWEETEPSIFPDSNDNSDDDDKQPKLTSEQDTILVPGDSTKLALDDEDITISVATDLMLDQTERDPKKLHELLCHIIDICDPAMPTSVDKSKIKQTSYGQRYIEIYVLENANELLQSNLVFEIDVETNGMQIKRRYFIDIQKRTKRATTTTTYSKWVYRSIRHESLFPDYGQHRHSTKPCDVGGVPVAWAMIFGYYDRRSHTYPTTYGTGSQGLYRCGSDGTFGSNRCKAPSGNDARTRKYNEKLHTILNTFCRFGRGLTYNSVTDNIASFFANRQTSGSPSVSLTKSLLHFPGIYYNKARDAMVDSIKTGWPTLIGLDVKGLFGAQSGVVTKIRERTKTVKVCSTFLWWTNCDTRSEKQIDMYVHMGKNGAQNSWRKAEIYFAVLAKY